MCADHYVWCLDYLYIYLTINQLLITYILPNYLMIQGFSNVFQRSLASALISDLQAAGYDAIQWCLVDCPGHASLIRTVIGDVATGATGGVRGEGESSWHMTPADLDGERHVKDMLLSKLVGGFKHDWNIFSISYMGCDTSHWRTPSLFKMVIDGHIAPPTRLWEICEYHLFQATEYLKILKMLT